jgi:hypothetical protein
MLISVMSELQVGFSVGFTMTATVHAVLDALPWQAWTPAIEVSRDVGAVPRAGGSNRRRRRSDAGRSTVRTE